MKIVTVVGARPQFIKAAALSRLLRERHTEYVVHTGQHYDSNMSDVFFAELGMPPPFFNLKIGSGSHGVQTGLMLIKLEEILQDIRPDRLIVYGDTNSTLAGALAGVKLNIPIIHIEAGLRSFNRAMPEEINRVITDHLSTWLLCPSQTSVENLDSEGLVKNVHLVGDIMINALDHAARRAKLESNILNRFNLTQKSYALATIHRAENTDDPQRLQQILDAFRKIEIKIVFPIHPRTRKALASFEIPKNILLIEPVGYLDMVMLEMMANVILTDSGGIQKEAYWLGTSCITLRNETEWVETVESGWNTLTGAITDVIVCAAKDTLLKSEITRQELTMNSPIVNFEFYGNLEVGKRCLEIISNT